MAIFTNFFDDVRQNFEVSFYQLIRKALKAENIKYEFTSYKFGKHGGEFTIPLKTKEGKHYTGKVVIMIKEEQE